MAIPEKFEVTEGVNKDKPLNIRIVEWVNEDEMTNEQMYDALFPLSRVNIIRIFPKKIEVIDDQAQELMF